jgi:GxxExxY protein
MVLFMRAQIDEISYKIVGACIEVHWAPWARAFGGIHQACLIHELRLRGAACQAEVPISLSYKGKRVDCCFRADLLVENLVLVEVKSVQAINDVHRPLRLS